MPWTVVPNHDECGDGKFGVVANGTDELESCHATREAADEHVKALYAKEPKQKSGQVYAAADIPNVELARPGTWILKTGPLEVTSKHLDDAARFANRAGARPGYLKIGHTDPRFVAADGEPALGWLYNIRVEDDDGPVLKGDLKDMPDWLAEAIPRHWPDRSIEGYEDYEHDGERYALVVDGLSLLGVTPPGMPSIRSLRDLPAALGVAASGPLEPSGRRIVASFGGAQISAPRAVAPPTTGGAGMTVPKYREVLAGLPDDASEADVEAALKSAGFTPTPPDPVPVAASAAQPGTIVLASSVWDETQKTIKTLTDFVDKTKRSERDDVIAKAVVAGKFTPAQKPHFSQLWDADPDGTRRLIDTLMPNSALAVMASGYAGDADDLDREYAALYGAEKVG